MGKLGGNPLDSKFTALLVVLLIGISGCYFALKYELLQSHENQTWDWRLRLVADKSNASKNIKIIAIDQISLEHRAEEQVVEQKRFITIFEHLTTVPKYHTAKFQDDYQDFDHGASDDALAKFSKLKKDPVAMAYAKIIESELENNFEIENWSPVWKLEAK